MFWFLRLLLAVFTFNFAVPFKMHDLEPLWQQLDLPSSPFPVERGMG